MIDLPDHGYMSARIIPLDPAGIAEGSLGGPSDIIDRPGYRYSLAIETKPLRTSDEARIFQSLLERGAREDVSYPWPCDIRSRPAGVPVVDGSNPTGAVIAVRGLVPNFQFRIGQPLAVIVGDYGFIHKATEATIADAAGAADVPVNPLTRMTFPDASEIEIEKPRIRGILSWDGAEQGTAGVRSFKFMISERR